MLESLLNKAAGLTPILKDRYFVKNCFCTAHTPLIVFFRFTLYSAPSSSSSQLLLRSSRPEVFYKKRCSEKFHKIHSKTPVSESLFLIKLQSLGPGRI